MLINLETREIKEIDIEVPFYSEMEYDDKTEYICIDEKYIRKISLSMCGSVEFFKFKKPDILNEHFYRYQCPKECWDKFI